LTGQKWRSELTWEVCFAINEVAKRIVGKDVESIFNDMGAFWEFCAYSQTDPARKC
jgi:hypothetical protein